jgi:hypothetical protein
MALGPTSCTASISTFYSNCPALNVGCYLYNLISGSYLPVLPGRYSNGNKCAQVRETPADGYIESWEDCPTFWNLQFSYNCSTQATSGNGVGVLYAYGYFPDNPSFEPSGGFWYQQLGLCEVGATGPCMIWNVIGLDKGPAITIDPTKDVIPLIAINYDQTSVTTVCQGGQIPP